MSKKTTKNPLGAGAPKKFIDWEQVEKLGSMWCTKYEIASFFGIDPKTLTARCKEKYGCDFSVKLKEYHDKGNIDLRQNQMKLSKISAPMAIHLGKNYLGQKDKIDIAVEESIVVDPVTVASAIELILAKEKEQLDESASS